MKKLTKRFIPFLLIFVLAGCELNFNSSTNSSSATESSSTNSSASNSSSASSSSASYIGGDYDDEVCTTTITLSNGNTTATATGTATTIVGVVIDNVNNIITIQNPGTYTISGILSDGQIVINSAKEENILNPDVDLLAVNLILAGVSVTSSKGAPLYVEQAEDTTIETYIGTTNTFTDPSTYSDTTTSACIDANDDIKFKGDGTLIVNGNYNNGIHSSNDIKIKKGTIEVNAANNGIKGDDSVEIEGGTITIESSGDGLKTDYDMSVEDGTKGYIEIFNDKNIVLNISAGEDGIQADNYVDIYQEEGSTKTISIGITSGGGSTNSSSTNPSWGNWGNSSSSDSTSESSAKGIKGGQNILISYGTININSSDDSIHSNANLTISGGTITALSGDDGIHAETDLNISGGNITISKSYEGIEATNIYISGGTINATASDDGLNAAGGSDTNTSDRPGGWSTTSTGYLAISGGTMTISALGDCLDSNGNALISGGTVYALGPTSGGNGILDFGDNSGNYFKVTGGTLLGAGTSDMAVTVATETQCVARVSLSSSYSSGSTVKVTTSTGTTIIDTVTVNQTIKMLYVSSASMTKGTTYYVYINGTKVKQFTTSSSSYWTTA